MLNSNFIYFYNNYQNNEFSNTIELIESILHLHSKIIL